jgi:hypothetical protein
VFSTARFCEWLCSVLFPPFAFTSACTAELVRFCHCGIVIAFLAFLSSMQQAHAVLMYNKTGAVRGRPCDGGGQSASLHPAHGKTSSGLCVGGSCHIPKLYLSVPLYVRMSVWVLIRSH